LEIKINIIERVYIAGEFYDQISLQAAERDYIRPAHVVKKALQGHFSILGIVAKLVPVLAKSSAGSSFRRPSISRVVILSYIVYYLVIKICGNMVS
jgi:hypothetical protein